MFISCRKTPNPILGKVGHIHNVTREQDSDDDWPFALDMEGVLRIVAKIVRVFGWAVRLNEANGANSKHTV